MPTVTVTTTLNETNVNPGGGVDSVDITIGTGAAVPTAAFTWNTAGADHITPTRINLLDNSDPGAGTIDEWEYTVTIGGRQWIFTTEDVSHDFLFPNEDFSVSYRVHTEYGWSDPFVDTVTTADIFDHTYTANGSTSLASLNNTIRAHLKDDQSVHLRIDDDIVHRAGSGGYIYLNDDGAAGSGAGNARLLITPLNSADVQICSTIVLTGWTHLGGNIWSKNGGFTPMADRTQPNLSDGAWPTVATLGIRGDRIIINSVRGTPFASQAELSQDGDFYIDYGADELYVYYTGTLTSQVVEAFDDSHPVSSKALITLHERDNIVIHPYEGSITLRHSPCQLRSGLIDIQNTHNVLLDGGDLPVEFGGTGSRFYIKEGNGTGIGCGVADTDEDPPFENIEARRLAILGNGSPNWLGGALGDGMTVEENLVYDNGDRVCDLGDACGNVVGGKFLLVNALLIKKNWLEKNRAAAIWIDGAGAGSESSEFPSQAVGGAMPQILENIIRRNNGAAIILEMIAGNSGDQLIVSQNASYQNGGESIRFANAEYVVCDNNEFLEDTGRRGLGRDVTAQPNTETAIVVTGAPGRDVPALNTPATNITFTNNKVRHPAPFHTPFGSTAWNAFIASSTFDDNTYEIMSDNDTGFDQVGDTWIGQTAWQALASGWDENSTFTVLNPSSGDTVKTEEIMHRFGNLIAHWPLDDASGAAARNALIDRFNIPDAVISGVTTYQVTGANPFNGPGELGMSLTPDPSYIDFYSLKLDQRLDKDRFWLTFDFKGDTGFFSGGYADLLMIRPDANNFLNIIRPSNGVLRCLWRGGGSNVSLPDITGLSDGVWYRIAVIVDVDNLPDAASNSLRFIVNGNVQMASAILQWTTTTLNANQTCLGVNSIATGANNAEGSFAHLAIGNDLPSDRVLQRLKLA